MKKVTPAPKRTMLFLAVTAEEQGLLGSQYYGQFPLYPLDKTLANINLDDNLPMWGRTKDVIVIGLGASDLDDYLRDAATEQGGRVLVPDAEPEKGFYYRSDHFNFAKAGVPALDTDDGLDYVGKPAGIRQAEEGRVHRERLSLAVRRGEARLGSHRPGRAGEAAIRGRLPRCAGGQVPGVETGERVQGGAGKTCQEIEP